MSLRQVVRDSECAFRCGKPPRDARACLAALGVQEEAKRLAIEVHDCDGVELLLRVGLNSGQVIAGEICSGSLGYTAMGEQVGLAQRMESVASPGGVMLSESTARLVEAAAVLGEPEMVHIKGADELVSARRLHSIGAHRGGVGRRVSTLVGRGWETSYRDYRDRYRAMADIARFRGAYGDG